MYCFIGNTMIVKVFFKGNIPVGIRQLQGRQEEAAVHGAILEVDKIIMWEVVKRFFSQIYFRAFNAYRRPGFERDSLSSQPRQ